MLLIRAYEEEMGTLQHLYCSRLLSLNIVVLESFLEPLLAILKGIFSRNICTSRCMDNICDVKC